MKAEDAPRRLTSRWGLLALVATMLGFLNFFIVMTSWRAEGNLRSLELPFVWEMTGAYAFLLLLPGMVYVMRKFPIEGPDIWRRVLVHLVAMGAFGITHTLLMWGSRVAIYGFLGWGSYDYGDMRYRFLMEGGKQVLGYGAVYAIVSLETYVRRNRERELLAVRLSKELTEARLAALKMQLNPHFLFNTLNMISSHVYTSPKTADAMIVHLSEFLRLTLRHSDAQEVPLAKELEFLSSYLAIMKARFEERLGVTIDVPPDVAEALVPHLILQPLVENSITHAMGNGTGGGRIQLSARRGPGQRLVLMVEDDGPGLPDETHAASGRGIGLTNTKERLRHLYGDDQSLTLSNGPEGGVRLEIELPWRAA